MDEDVWNSKPHISVKLDIIEWQNVKKTFNFRIELMIFPLNLKKGGKFNKSQRVQKLRWAHLNRNLAVSKTQKVSEKPWFSNFISLDIFLDL